MGIIREIILIGGLIGYIVMMIQTALLASEAGEDDEWCVFVVCVVMEIILFAVALMTGFELMN